MSGIMYKGYQIIMDSDPSPYVYAYMHKDFDGYEDTRYGYGYSLPQILSDIDDAIAAELTKWRIARNQ